MQDSLSDDAETVMLPATEQLLLPEFQCLQASKQTREQIEFLCGEAALHVLLSPEHSLTGSND